MIAKTYRRTYKIWFILVDLLTFAASFMLAISIRFGTVDAIKYMHEKSYPLYCGLFMFFVIFYLCGLYEPLAFTSYKRVLSRVGLSVLMGLVLVSFLFYATFSLAIGRGVFALGAFFIFIITCASRLAYVLNSKKQYLVQRVLIFGNESGINDAIGLIKNTRSSLYQVGGVASDDKRLQDSSIKGYKVLCNLDNLGEALARRKIGIILVASTESRRRKILHDLRALRYSGFEITDIVSLYEDLKQKVPVKYIDDEWLLSSSIRYSSFHVKKLKRLVDIIVALFGLAVTLPVSALAAILIKLDTKGPVFLRQKRLGCFSKPFRVIKFRSMIHKAEKGLGGPVLSQENDPRITRVGKWIRKTRRDEIPQLVNVLLGQMSLVGPRPERPLFVKELSEKIPYYPERLYVQPGITGWAQVNASYASDINAMQEKLEYDLYYINHISFFLDLYILFKTLQIMLKGSGR